MPTSGRFIAEDGSIINLAKAISGGEDTGIKADISRYAAHTGRFIAEDGSIINLADNLRSKGEDTGLTADIRSYMPTSGRFIAEDGSVINLAKVLGTGGGKTISKDGLIFSLGSSNGFETLVEFGSLNLSVTSAITLEWKGTLTGISTTDTSNPSLGRLFAFRTGLSPSLNGFEVLVENKNNDYYLELGVNNNWIGGQAFINHFGKELKIPTNDELTISITVDSESFKIYYDGTLVVSSSTYQNAFSAITYTYGVLMSNYSQSGAHQSCSGNVKSLRMYNRALTADEVLSNSEADI